MTEGESLYSRCGVLTTVTYVVVKGEEEAQSRMKAVLGAFADLAIEGGFVSLTALRAYLDSSVAMVLPSLIAELGDEGLVKPVYDTKHGGGIKLTAKGAVRLWFWNWSEDQRNRDHPNEWSEETREEEPRQLAESIEEIYALPPEWDDRSSNGYKRVL